jgi:hypothetical protein
MLSWEIQSNRSRPIQPLQTKIGTRDGKSYLTVSGKGLGKENWLGVSFYKPDYSDPVLDGDYATYLVTEQEFTRTMRVPTGFETGTYEVALWRSLDAKKEVYKLETLRAYGTGYAKE